MLLFVNAAMKGIFIPKRKSKSFAENTILSYFVTDEQFADKEKFPWNIHPLAFISYVWAIANMVRTGVLTRGQGIEKIEPPEDKGIVNYSPKELGID